MDKMTPRSCAIYGKPREQDVVGDGLEMPRVTTSATFVCNIIISSTITAAKTHNV